MFTKIAFAALIAAAPVAASAVELITNGNFEAAGGSLAGWTATDNVVAIKGSAYVQFAGGVGSPAAQANTFASFGAGGTAGTETLSQTLGTVAGRTYNLSFDYGSFSSDQTVTLFVGGAQIGSYTGTGTNNLDTIFNTATYSFTGTGNPTSILFSVVTALNDDRDALVDNVSVSAVPDAATWTLLIAGFVMVGAAARRRRMGSVAA